MFKIDRRKKVIKYTLLMVGALIGTIVLMNAIPKYEEEA